MDQPDLELEKTTIKKARRGDNLAFEEIIYRYERVIFNYIFGLVRQKQDAEDLTQETFIKLYKNIRSVDPEGNIRGLLYKIATNSSYDWFKKKKIRPELFIIDDPESSFETIDEDLSYIKLETAKDIEIALSKLKVVYRVVLLLFYWQGLSYEEIASALSLPINTIKTNIRRAKQELKELLLGNKQGL